MFDGFVYLAKMPYINSVMNIFEFTESTKPYSSQYYHWDHLESKNKILVFSQMSFSQQSEPSSDQRQSQRITVESRQIESEHYSQNQLHETVAYGEAQQITFQETGNIHSEYQQLRAAYEELHHYLEGQKEAVESLEAENAALRGEVTRYRESRQQSPSNFQAKYQKALKEISNLLTINKQLKEEIEYIQNSKQQSGISQQTDQGLSSALAKAQKAQDLNRIYQQKFNEFKQNLIKQQSLYEQKIDQMTKHMENYADDLKVSEQRCRQLQQRIQNQAVNQHINMELEAVKKEYQGMIDSLMVAIEKQNKEAELAEVRERELENRVAGLEEQVALLNTANNNLKDANQIMSRDNEVLKRENKQFQEQAKRSGRPIDNSVELRQYIERLKAQTSKLQEVLKSREQLQADKNNLNREIINLNKQISQLTNENSQLQSRISSTANKQATLHEQVRRLQSQVIEQQRINTQLITRDGTKSIPVGSADQQRYIVQLKSEIQSLQSKLQLPSPQKPQQQKPQRLIPVQIRIRQLRAMLQLLMSSPSSSSVTIQTSHLLDIRTFTIQFQQRLKLLSNQNDHLKRKLKDYKQRYQSAQKLSDQTEKVNTQLTAKIDGYEKLVQRLEVELSKSIKKTQETAGQLTLHSLSRSQLENDLRVQIADLNEKLALQEKYFEQQMQTRTLEYEARLVSMRKQVEDAGQELQSIGLYTSKIQELSDKVVRLEITNNQLRVSASQQQTKSTISSTTRLPDQSQLIKQIYQKLTERQAQILRYEYSLKDKQAEIDQYGEAQGEMKQKVYELQMEIGRINEALDVSKKNFDKLESQARRASQQDSQKQAELARANQNLRSELRKYREYEQQSHTSKQVLHQTKVTNAQLSQKASQLQSQLSRLRQVQQSLRQLSLKHNQLQNTHQYTKSVFQAEKSRYQRYIKDKQTEIVESHNLLAKLRQDAEAEIQHLRNQLGEVSQQSEAIRRNSQISKFKNTEVHDDNIKLRAENSALLQEIDRYRQTEARCYDAERKVSEIGMNLESMKFKLEFALKQNQRMKNRVQEQEDTITKGYADVSEKERLIRAAQNNVYEINLKLEEEVFKNNGLKSEVDRLQKVVSDMLRDNLSNSRRLIAEASSPYKVLTQPAGAWGSAEVFDSETLRNSFQV